MKTSIALLLIPLFCACEPVGFSDQARLSRPVMNFTATGPRSFEGSLSGQLETGRASASNVSAGGCSSCR